MKKILILSTSTLLLVCSSGVTLANISFEDVPKTQIVDELSLELFSDTKVYESDYNSHIDYGFYGQSLSIEKETLYIGKVNLLYVSPDVDRKWVWSMSYWNKV